MAFCENIFADNSYPDFFQISLIRHLKCDFEKFEILPNEIRKEDGSGSFFDGEKK